LSGGDSTIRFCPPLITTPEQIEVGLEIFLVFITGTAD
jgi:4-aminobutyrate aminotransferase-like enzyme